MNIHDRTREIWQKSLSIWLPIIAQRSRRAPEWLRRKLVVSKRRVLMREAAREAVAVRRPHRLRPGVDSGRVPGWHLGLDCTAHGQTQSWGWRRYAAARRSLALAGYDAPIAREIARQAAQCETVFFAPSIGGVIPACPIDSEADCSGWDRLVWDPLRRAIERRTADDARRVRQWTAWIRALRNDDAPIGRRMRRWISIGQASA